MLVEGYTLFRQGRYTHKFQNSTFLSLMLSNVQFLSKAKDENIEKLTISFDSSELSETMVTDLSTLLSEHPGSVQLYLSVRSAESPVPLILHSRKQTIDVDRDILAYLDENPAMDYHIN